ncbi:MAG: dTMP kinase [Candidatus Omnitrophica bacterium]|nr:dTMP kinase [Candidatus Omnitrophota bacterium]
MGGFFITFEGPEGSGKSSQAKWLAQALRRRGHQVVFVRDPGSTVLGQRLRRVLLHTRRVRISPLAEALLFIAGRIQLVEEHVRPALRRGCVVICDRFHDSTMAYQGYGGGLDIAWLNQLGRRAIGGVMPRLTILLDVPTRVGFSRIRSPRDRMEQKARAFHHAVRQGFLKLARREPKRFIVLDATEPKSVLQQQVLTLVLRKLTHH